jgi:hypothetical protein
MIGGRDNRTPHNELGPYDTPREYARPIEEVARAICNSVEADNFDELPRASIHRAVYVQQANAALQTLRDLGYINDIGLRAIKTEERK